MTWSRGRFLPLGSVATRAGIKGYGLAVIVYVLCGVLSWRELGSVSRRRLRFAKRFPSAASAQESVVLWRPAIDGFIDRDSFKRQIDDYSAAFRATKPLPAPTGRSCPAMPEREAKHCAASMASPNFFRRVRVARHLQQRALRFRVTLAIVCYARPIRSTLRNRGVEKFESYAPLESFGQGRRADCICNTHRHFPFPPRPLQRRR